MCKLLVIFVALRIPAQRNVPVLMTMLTLLYAMPGFFKQISGGDHGFLPPLAIFSVWWLVGAMPLLLLLMRDHLVHGAVRIFVIATMLSVLVHLRLTNWVYHVDWEWSNIGPLLIGCAAGVASVRLLPLQARFAIQLVLPIIAIALSLDVGSNMMFNIASIPFSPLRTMLLCSAMVYLYAAILSGNVLFIVGVVVAMVFGLLGAMPGAMWKHGLDLIEMIEDLLERLVPKTKTQWGVTALSASFVLLVIGAGVSMLKRPVEES
jgi:hypothetical protein